MAEKVRLPSATNGRTLQTVHESVVVTDTSGDASSCLPSAHISKDRTRRIANDSSLNTSSISKSQSRRTAEEPHIGRYRVCI